jgi:hypothetical protein
MKLLIILGATICSALCLGQDYPAAPESYGDYSGNNLLTFHTFITTPGQGTYVLNWQLRNYAIISGDDANPMPVAFPSGYDNPNHQLSPVGIKYDRLDTYTASHYISTVQAINVTPQAFLASGTYEEVRHDPLNPNAKYHRKFDHQSWFDFDYTFSISLLGSGGD